jgi:hypothetical protein
MDHVQIIIQEENSKCHYENFGCHSARNLCRSGTGMTGVQDTQILIPFMLCVPRLAGYAYGGQIPPLQELSSFSIQHEREHFLNDLQSLKH